MRVSVILPIYNGEKTLIATLDSLVEQTFQDFELIACIDGTRDGSESILERYSNKFKQLKILINQKNRGLGPTMNRLVYESSGEYIAVAEQDDYYYTDRLALQVEKLDDEPSIGLVSGMSEFFNGNKITFEFPGLLKSGKQYPVGKEMFLLNYRKQIKVVNSCMMFRKSVHVDNGLYFTQHHPSISVDWTYVLRFSLVSKIVGISKILVRLDRRANRDSVTSNHSKQFRASRELIKNFYYEFPELISQEDFRYAMNTQRNLELGHLAGLKFFIVGVFYWIRFQDRRFLKKVLNRFKR